MPECCRDHHDTTATGVVKFDPEKGAIARSRNTTPMAPAPWSGNNTTSGDYVNACRVIRVDGFWRTGSDMYSRQFGLLETETVSGEKAETGFSRLRDHPTRPWSRTT